jgi:hypothetical protein
MTIPNQQRARLLYAVLVAAIAFFWQYTLFRSNALIWGLFLATPVVPLLDRLLPAPRFQWRAAPLDADAARRGPALPNDGLGIGR